MLDYLRHLRVYLYTGTTPASYTLGLIEAMLSGVPVVSITANSWQAPSPLFEGHEIAECGAWTAEAGRSILCHFLDEPGAAVIWSKKQRQRAIDLFDVATVGAQWREFLG
jgi:hypothetical protein